MKATLAGLQCRPLLLWLGPTSGLADEPTGWRWWQIFVAQDDGAFHGATGDRLLVSGHSRPTAMGRTAMVLIEWLVLRAFQWDFSLQA